MFSNVCLFFTKLSKITVVKLYSSLFLVLISFIFNSISLRTDVMK